MTDLPAEITDTVIASVPARARDLDETLELTLVLKFKPGPYRPPTCNTAETLAQIAANVKRDAS